MILEILREKRVLRIEPTKDGTGFLVEENCDNYFSVMLSKKDMRRFGQELIDLANNPNVEDVDFDPKSNRL